MSLQELEDQQDHKRAVQDALLVQKELEAAKEFNRLLAKYFQGELSEKLNSSEEALEGEFTLEREVKNGNSP